MNAELKEQMRGSGQVIRVVNYPESSRAEPVPAQRLQSALMLTNAHDTKSHSLSAQLVLFPSHSVITRHLHSLSL